MKYLATFSAVVAAVLGAILTWWHISDGTRFNRTMHDLLELSPDALNKHNVIDPWGNTYITVTSTSGMISQRYIASRGPNGRTDSPGNESDDISRWTDQSKWLTALHPVSWVNGFLGMSLLTFIGSTSFLIGRTRKENENAEQASSSNSG